MSTAIQSSSPYVLLNKPIVYNILATEGGWRLEAYVAPRVSPEDRITVLEWLNSYKAQVRRTHPSWIVSFRAANPYAYSLDIRRVDQKQERAAETEKLKQMWHQLAFDYA